MLAYLDHAATTPVRPEAAEAMLPWLTSRYGNPSGGHAVARAARQAVEFDGLGEHLVVGGVRATRAGTFADGQPGRLVAYVDSAGKVALAVNGGRAVVALAVTPGDILRLANA